MPTPRTVVSATALADAAARLLDAASSLTQSVQLMNQEGLAEALIPWTNAHWVASDKLVEASVLVAAAVRMEAAAHKQGRKSSAMLERERGQRDRERIKARKADSGDPPKKRGRPKKKAD